MRASPLAILAAASLLSGCFLDRAPLAPNNGPNPPDDGGTSRLDAGRRDATVPPDDDGGPTPVDSGPPCTSTDERCEGDTAIVCEPSGLRTIDCAAMSASCQAASCVPRACTPSAVECSGDGASVVTCNATGTMVEGSTPCARGCAAGACRPQTACGSAVDATMRDGAMTFDLCGGVNNSDFADGPGCDDWLEANGQDRIVRLEVDRPGRYRIELTNASDHALDAAVYVRTACEDRGSEIGCANGGVSTFSLDARLEIDLAAGDYFVILDSLDYSIGITTRCGPVQLTITRL